MTVYENAPTMKMVCSAIPLMTKRALSSSELTSDRNAVTAAAAASITPDPLTLRARVCVCVRASVRVCAHLPLQLAYYQHPRGRKKAGLIESN